MFLGTIPAIFDACNLDSAVDYSTFTSLLIDLASIMQKQSDINGPALTASFRFFWTLNLSSDQGLQYGTVH